MAISLSKTFPSRYLGASCVLKETKMRRGLRLDGSALCVTTERAAHGYNRGRCSKISILFISCNIFVYLHSQHILFLSALALLADRCPSI